MSLYDDIYGYVKDKAGDVYDSATTPAPVGSTRPSIYDQIYGGIKDYGQRTKENLKEYAAERFRESNTGIQLTAEVKKQEIAAMLANPLYWMIGAVIILVIFMVGKKS